MNTQRKINRLKKRIRRLKGMKKRFDSRIMDKINDYKENIMLLEAQ